MWAQTKTRTHTPCHNNADMVLINMVDVECDASFFFFCYMGSGLWTDAKFSNQFQFQIQIQITKLFSFFCWEGGRFFLS